MCIMHTGCSVAVDVDCLNDKRKLLRPLKAMYEMSKNGKNTTVTTTTTKNNDNHDNDDGNNNKKMATT